jgi:hypothetical protein
MRDFLIFYNYFENYRSVIQVYQEVIKGVPFQIIHSTVWVNDKFEEIPEDQANDPSLYVQSLEQENLKTCIEDNSVIVKKRKIKAINSRTNEEERVYSDARSGINVVTPEQMMERLKSKITNSQNTPPTPPPNLVTLPSLDDLNQPMLGPSVIETNTNTVRRPFTEQ